MVSLEDQAASRSDDIEEKHWKAQLEMQKELLRAKEEAEEKRRREEREFRERERERDRQHQIQMLQIASAAFRGAMPPPMPPPTNEDATTPLRDNQAPYEQYQQWDNCDSFQRYTSL